MCRVGPSTEERRDQVQALRRAVGDQVEVLELDRPPGLDDHIGGAAHGLDPRAAAPVVSLGVLRMKQARYIDALGYLNRAASLDALNYLAH